MPLGCTLVSTIRVSRSSTAHGITQHSVAIGTGAYRVTEFVPDDHVTMVANATYWRGKPTIDRVIWRPVPEATARIAALLVGEAQLIESVPVELVEAVDASGQAKVVRVRNGGLIIYLGLKSAEAALNVVRVRRALSIAIDRREIVDQVLIPRPDDPDSWVLPDAALV